MRQEYRDGGRLPDRRSSSVDAADAGEPTSTADEIRMAEALADGLGQLRTARPGFQEELERRLLARLSEPPRPWWRRMGPSRQQLRRPSRGSVRLPRRSMLGLAAAAALALTAASLSLPLFGTSDASAREILERVQANSENPGLAGVKSFHLSANIWTDTGPKPELAGGMNGPHAMTTEQWFVAPDRMRTETRTQDASGKTVVSGFMVNGDAAKQYATDGAQDVLMIGVFTAPIGAKPAILNRGVGPAPTGSPQAIAAGVAVGALPPGGDGQKPLTVALEVNGPGEGEKGPGQAQVEHHVFVTGENCPEPKRTGEGTVASRPVFVIENTFGDCLPADAPARMRGRHVRWVDQQTYLPLKMEMYDEGGKLVDRYEVTSIQYDMTIPDTVFTDLPAGTSARAMPPFPKPPAGPDAAPASRPSTP